MTLGGVEDQWVRYWDESATIAKLEYEVSEASAQQPAPAKEKEKKRKKGPAHPMVPFILLTSGLQS